MLQNVNLTADLLKWSAKISYPSIESCLTPISDGIPAAYQILQAITPHLSGGTEEIIPSIGKNLFLPYSNFNQLFDLCHACVLY